MLLSLTSINSKGELRTFSCECPRLEMILDLLSNIAAHGDQLLTVALIEDNKQILLPVEAFDGQLFSVPIRELEKQWQQVLSWPVS